MGEAPVCGLSIERDPVVVAACDCAVSVDAGVALVESEAFSFSFSP